MHTHVHYEQARHTAMRGICTVGVLTHLLPNN